MAEITDESARAKQMIKRNIAAPDIYKATGYTHAVRAGGALYTSGIVAMDRSGKVVGKGDVTLQTKQVFDNLSRILTAANVDWKDVANITALVPPSCRSWENLDQVQGIISDHLPARACAGTVVVTDLLNPDYLLEVELVAYPDKTKTLITDVPGAQIAAQWAHGVKVDGMLYVSGQQAPNTRSDRGPTEARGVASTSSPEQTQRVYENHDAVLRAAGLSWEHVVKISQYIAQEDRTQIEVSRKARGQFPPAGRFMCDTVVTSGDVESNITVEMVGSSRDKRFISVPDVWTPPGEHAAIDVSGATYVNGQVARDLDGTPLFPGDFGRQANLVYKNLDKVLAASDLSWTDVVQIRTYIKTREDIAAIRRVRDEWLPAGNYTSTMAVAEYPDRELLVEVGLIAIRSPGR